MYMPVVDTETRCSLSSINAADVPSHTSPPPIYNGDGLTVIEITIVTESPSFLTRLFAKRVVAANTLRSGASYSIYCNVV